MLKRRARYVGATGRTLDGMPHGQEVPALADRASQRDAGRGMVDAHGTVHIHRILGLLGRALLHAHRGSLAHLDHARRAPPLIDHNIRQQGHAGEEQQQVPCGELGEHRAAGACQTDAEERDHEVEALAAHTGDARHALDDAGDQPDAQHGYADQQDQDQQDQQDVLHQRPPFPGAAATGADA